MSKKPATRPNKGFFGTVLAAALLAIASASAGPDARAQPERGSTPGDFDYYVLALSWSPTYCGGQAENDGDGGGYEGRYGYGRSYGDPVRE